jgi:thiol-disulfide isomerase/thioredoxin
MSNHDTSTEPSKESRSRSSCRRQVLCLAIVVFAGAALSSQYWLGLGKSSSAPATSHSKAFGKQVTTLKLAALTEHSQVISSDRLEGKVTLINFWGPWCVQCRVEMPFLDDLRKQMEKFPDFSFISVSCGPDISTESIEDLKTQTIEYLRSTGMLFPVHWDPQGRTRRALLETAATTESGVHYPLNVLFDRDGLIRGFWMGSSHAIEKEIQESVDRELANPSRADKKNHGSRG